MGIAFFRSKLLMLGAGLLAFQAVPTAQATLLFEEGFNYTAGGGLGGNAPWGAGSSNIVVGSSNLTYPGLTDAANPGNDVTVTSGVAAGTVAAAFNASPITSGTIYYSFLAQPTALPTANQYLTSLNPTGGVPNGGSDALAVYVGQQSAGLTYKVGIRHNGIGTGASFAPSNANFTLNSLNFFVVGYTFNTAASNDDSISLWVNPAPGGGIPAADVTVTGPTGVDAANLQSVGFKAQSAATAGNWNFDTLRIGDTWADVTPSVPEPASATLLVIGGSLMSLRRRRNAPQA